MRYTIKELRSRVSAVNNELEEMGYAKRINIANSKGHGYQVVEVLPEQEFSLMPAGYYSNSHKVGNCGSLLLCEAVINGYMRGVYMASEQEREDAMRLRILRGN